MNFFDYKAIKIWIADNFIHVKLEDGKEGKLPINNFQRLANAHPDALRNFEVIDGYAIHWPELDEDLSVEGFFVLDNAMTEQT
jgi:hypothetical protein